MNKKAFTLIELIIVIIVVGILSVLLFRTLSDMIKTNARVQQEKILAQEMIGIQTSLNSISEHYPYVDQAAYSNNNLTTNSQWIVSKLHLINDNDEKITISGTGDCSNECYLIAQINDDQEMMLTNKKLSKFSNITFKILPIQNYTTSQYEENFQREHISQPWFWVFGTLTNNLKPWYISKVSYNIQHFINLKIKTLDETE